MDDLAAILTEPVTDEEALCNVARCLLQYTEVTRRSNGRGRHPTRQADPETIAQTGRHLAELVLSYLDR